MENYINNDELERELQNYLNSSDNPSQRMASERLGQLLLMLHDHILEHMNFRGYREELKEEMRSYSLYRIMKCGLNSWNPKKGHKAFSYFTQAVFLNYIQVIARYYKKLNQQQQYIKDMLMKLGDEGMKQWEALSREYGVSEATEHLELI